MKPNILYIFTDQMRSTAVGCYGEEDVQTPNLDRFAAEGSRFTRATANIPLCCPSRGTLMTGCFPFKHGILSNDIPLRTDMPTVARQLNDVGYRCGYIGKWHIDDLDRGAFIPPGPRRQGFDDYWAVANCNHRYFDGYYYENDNPEPVWIDGYEPDAQTDLAIRYIENQQDGESPFCLYLSWGPPHCPYAVVPDKYKAMYPPESIKLKPNAPDHADRDVISGYYAHVTALDACFGRIMESLDRTGQADNTLVIFTSDHGDMLFSQDRGWKSKPWAESVFVPFIARWPGKIPAGRVSHKPLGIVDMMPTLCSLAGADVPASVEGSDLSVFLLGDDAAGTDSQLIMIPWTYAAYSCKEWRGVVTEQYTYAEKHGGPWLLYDDQADPYQLENLVDRPDSSEIQADLAARMRDWLEKTGDHFPTTEELIEQFGYADKVDVKLTMPFYENDVIVNEREARQKRRGVNTFGI